MKKTAIAARTQLHFSKSFLHGAPITVSNDYLVIFLYAGKRDWIVYLNVEPKDNFGMADGEWQFF